MDTDKSHQLYVESMKFVQEQSHTEDEWNEYNRKVIENLRKYPDAFGEEAIHLLSKGIHRRYVFPRKRNESYPKLKDTAIPQIVAAILENPEKSQEHLMFFGFLSVAFEKFTGLPSWWDGLHEKKEQTNCSDDIYEIGKLYWYMFDRSNWAAARRFIEPHLDHPNPRVRASAALALVRLYEDKISGLPPIIEVLNDIKERDIKRPGVAGPFWMFVTNSSLQETLEKDNPQFDELEWLLDIIEKRNGNEPRFPGLMWVDFLAYDVAANNLNALRRLIKADSREAVVQLAFEFDQFTEEFHEILVEMGNSECHDYCSTGSTLLAYYYRELHPEGLRKGIVKEYVKDDVIIFWVEDKDDPLDCAAVIYPKDGQMQDTLTWKWVKILLPPDDRNSLWDSRWRTHDSVLYGFTDQNATFYGNIKNKLWDKVIVRKPTRREWMDEK